MRVGIVGSGRIGGTLGKLWARAGHSVLFSSRHPEELAALAADAAHGARTGTPQEAAAFGEVLVLAVPAPAVPALLAELDGLAGKIVVDTSNTFRRRGGGAALPDRGVTLVKAFNTLPSRTLAQEGGGPEAQRLVLFHATDDERAKTVAAQLIRDAGFAPVDAGGLADAVRQEPGGALFNRELTVEDAAELLDRSGQEPVPDVDDDRAYFEQLTRAVLRAGSNRAAAEARMFEAIVANAATAVALIHQHGSIQAYLRSFASPRNAMRDLQQRFAGLGPDASRWFLHSVGEPTPSD